LRLSLDLVIIGFNPSVPAWRTGHYYANPRNDFYRLLYRHGFTSRLLAPADDVVLPTEFGIGMTDLVARPSAMARDIPVTEFRAAVRDKLANVVAFRPAVICCNGYGVYRLVAGTQLALGSGACAATEIGGIPVYAVPSSSGAACALRAERERSWAVVGAAVALVRAKRGSA